MKFLVLALAICTANAASSFYGNFNQNKPYQNRYNSGSVATAQAVVNVPAAKVAKEPVVSAPVVPAPVARDPTYVPKNSQTVEIIEDVKEQTPEGGFVSKFQTSDGTSVESVGTKKVVGDAEVLSFTGYYKYYNDDGQEVYLRYVADENGFVAESPFLPVAPKVPEEIAAALDYLAKQAPYVEPTKQ